jgi:hypothetical protein
VLLLAGRPTLPRGAAVIDRADAQRLAGDLLLTALEDTPVGLKGVFLALREMDDRDRDLVMSYADGIGARAISELASIWDVEPAEALRRITEGDDEP